LIDLSSIVLDDIELDDPETASKRPRTVLFDNLSLKGTLIRPELLVSPVPTSKIAHLIPPHTDDLEEKSRSLEEAEVIKHYNMNQAAGYSEKDQSGDSSSSTFASNKEIKRLNLTLHTIKRKQERLTARSRTTSKRPVTTQNTSTTSTTREEPISHLIPDESHKEEGDESQTAPEESPIGQSASREQKEVALDKEESEEGSKEYDDAGNAAENPEDAAENAGDAERQSPTDEPDE